MDMEKSTDITTESNGISCEISLYYYFECKDKIS